ncbi:MAG: hypothetical protein Q7T20_00600 [Saprospiraceae bacterium]|nr:hypothetical protein [Saprospiraceae bacterium]
MKKQLTLFAAFLLAISLQAQAPQTVVLVSSTGEVGLIPKGKKKAKPIQNGAVLKTTGKLQLAAGAEATVYCNGQFKTLAGSPSVELSGVCAKGGSAPTDAGYDFGEKLMAAVDMMAVAKKRGDGWSNSVTDPKRGGDGWGNSVTDPKRGGDGWGNSVTDPKRGGDGWGGKGSKIRIILPFGKVIAETTAFSWSRPANAEPYLLVIKDEANKIVHSVTLRDTFARIDLRALNLTMDKIYHWGVSVSGSKPMTSNELEFSIGSEEELKEIEAYAKSSSLAGSTKSPTVGSLIEATALENGRWYYAAQKVYAELQQKYPDNVVRMMHAAFWMRYGFRYLAENVARG